MADAHTIPYRPTFDPERHEYRWQGRLLSHVTAILLAANIRRPIPCDPATLTLAGWRGSLIHAATLKVDNGEDTGVADAPALAGYVEAYASFCSAHIFVGSSVWSEQPICDPTLGVAGTPDRVGYLGEQLHGAVLDLKTGEPDPSIGVQLAAYRYLLRANGMPVAHRLSVHLRPNGTFRVHEYTDSGDEAAFLAAVTIYRWQQRHERVAA
jgi:hypothetical protein